MPPCILPVCSIHTALNRVQSFAGSCEDLPRFFAETRLYSVALENHNL